MSGERPVPLWPVALQKDLKLRPVENQRTEALTPGVSAPVAKQPELSTPGEQPGQQPTEKPIVPLFDSQSASRLLIPEVPDKEVVETLDPEVEEAIRQYGMAVGDPEEEAQLREQAKIDPALREFFKKGPTLSRALGQCTARAERKCTSSEVPILGDLPAGERAR